MHFLPSERVALFIDGANHFSFVGTGVALGRTQDQSEEPKIAQVIREASTAWWDLNLKESPAAKEFLAKDEIDEIGHVEHK